VCPRNSTGGTDAAFPKDQIVVDFARKKRSALPHHPEGEVGATNMRSKEDSCHRLLMAGNKDQGGKQNAEFPDGIGTS
jgi:hypothetical protein